MRKMIVAALVSLGPVATVWSQAQVGPSASGHGNLTILDGLQTLSFQARQFKDGSVTGSMVVKSRAQNARLFAELDCLHVLNNVAVLSGIVTKSDNPMFPAGRHVIFRVIDNGEGANDRPDMMTDVLTYPGGTPKDCHMLPGPPIDMVVEEGNIQVRPTVFSILP
jgi:hypothetical protein